MGRELTAPIQLPSTDMNSFAGLPGLPVESDRVDKVWKKPKSSGVLHPTLLSD
jgi:hypothetical protein